MQDKMARIMRERGWGTWSLIAGLVFCAFACTGRTLVAQDYVVGWGDRCFDTRIHSGPVRYVSANDYSTGVITGGGRVIICGGNGVGSCRIPLPPPGAYYTHIAPHEFYSIGLRSDGVAIAWNDYPPLLPVIPPPPAGLRYTWMSADGAVLRLSDGTFVAWDTAYPIPTFPAGVTPAVMSSGYPGRYGAIMSDGSLVMWGDNTYGQLTVPAIPPGVAFTAFSIANYHTLALLSDGRITAFGTGSWRLNVPPLPPGTNYLLCSAGTDHSVAYRSDNVLIAWGLNQYGQMDVPTLPPGVRCIALDAGLFHTAALLSDGRLLTWGLEGQFQAGIPSLPGTGFPGPWGPATARHAHIAVGGPTIWVYSDGSASGILESGYSVPTTSPGVGYVSAASGGQFSVLLRSDGELVLVGDGSGGQGAFQPLPPGLVWGDFAVSEHHTAMLRSDGQAFACGGTVPATLAIPALPPGMTYVDVDANNFKTMLVRSDGQIVGCGTAATATIPAPPLPAGVRYVAVAAGDNHNAALRSDGTAVQWDGSSMSLWVPVPPPPSGVSYVEVVAGNRTTVLRMSNGGVRVVGDILSAPRFAAVPRLEPGESYLQLSASIGNIAARVGPTSTYVSFARGCAGSQPASRLIPRDTPRIGKQLRVTLFDLLVDIAMLAMGMERSSPVSLGALGLTGCTWHVALDATALISGQGGQAVWELPIPDLPSLVGVQFHHQAVVLDPSSGNALGLVVSDAATGVIGFP